MAKPKQQQKKVIRYCNDCIHSTPDMKFENLSVDGKPTLLSCPYQEWRMIITTTETCDKYEDNSSEKDVIETEEPESPTKNWLDW